jgi:hypothetical protein
MPNEELLELQDQGRPDLVAEMVVQLRLHAAVRDLTKETVRSRESSERPTRELGGSVIQLTEETVRSRRSSERLISQLDSSVRGLTAETVEAARASDRAARWLIVLTVVLVLLTGALVALPFVQAATSPTLAPTPSEFTQQIRTPGSSPDASARSTRHGNVQHKPASPPDASPGS